ncbi:membrane hypothetical protein [Clostridium neonatale]|uniref:DUF7657 domain-containing protein n=1 Tax=Clostridium neonatale TaxID=137838 RepID=UPI00291B72FA|nr:hypothetical protein [Clostridium neonatale]CAI3633497.1 membrane hypothetical protein [Clostridium neonatale]
MIKNKNRAINLFFICIVTVVLTLLIEGIAFSNNVFSEFKNYKNNTYYTFKIEDFILNGYENVDNKYITNTNDPYFLKNDLNEYIQNVELKFDEPLISDLPISIYYSNKGEDLSEDQVIRVVAKKDRNYIKIDLNQNVKNIRIDIGDLKNQQFSISAINFNSKQTLKSCIMRLIIMFVIVFLGILLYIHKRKKVNNIVIKYKTWIILNSIIMSIVRLSSIESKYKVFIGMLIGNLIFIFINYITQDRIFEKIYKYRYYILLTIFIISVFIFKLNFSSITEYKCVLPNNISQVSNIEIGNSRGIRSDEYRVLTPLQLSQKGNNYNSKTNLLGENAAVSAISGGIPTKNITMIGKPFLWGYVLFGNDIGFSWYYISRVLLLFVFSYKFLFILVKNKKISLIGSVILCYAPGIQWWFTTNSLATEAIIYFEMIIVSMYNIFLKQSRRKIISYGILLLISTIGFALVLYPPLQIALFYLGILLLIGLYLDNKEVVEFNKFNILMVFFILIIWCLIIVNTIISILPDIHKIMNTVYPGKRLEIGGNLDLEYLFNYIPTCLLPFKETNYSNLSEISSYITLFPIPLIIYFCDKKIKKTNTINCVIIFIIVSFIFMFVGFPLILSKVTLMSIIPPARLFLVFGFASTILIIYITKNIETEKEKKSIIMQLCVYIVIMYAVYRRSADMLDYTSTKGFVFLALLFMIFIYYFNVNREMFINMMLVLNIAVGITINPVNFGIEEMNKTQFATAVRQIDSNDPGKWVTLEDITISKYILAQGVQTLNALNYPPMLDSWGKVDINGKYSEVYNRYAHVEVHLNSDYDKKFNARLGDLFEVNLSLEEMKKLDVKYIVTTQKITDYNNEIMLIYDDKLDDISIYKIK